ncbi:hypothetical protein [Aminicella lysinilytica]|nr:hypothetical protein [Aminicella lysinilytica]
MRKPVAVVGVLFLCFPVSIVLPLIAGAYAGSLVPAIGRKEKRGDEKN